METKFDPWEVEGMRDKDYIDHKDIERQIKENELNHCFALLIHHCQYTDPADCSCQGSTMQLTSTS